MTTTTAGSGTIVLHGAGRSIAAFFARHRADLLWLTPVLVLGAIVSFVGIAGSPQRIDDEGTYAAQAWAVLNFGELAHYTYWYDHPPVGWLQIAGYAGLTGAFERYDLAVLAAREAMIVATLISTVLLWVLARRFHLGRAAASVAAALFVLSPLAVQFHRTVYLDNLATPWLLAAFLLALSRRWQLGAFAASAAFFGIAVLSKETYLLALPFLIWVMVRSASKATRRYTLSVAASVLVLIGGGYLLLAAVKGELTPGRDQVSLLEGVTFQLGTRETSGSPFDPDSLMAATLGQWLQLDLVFIIVGIAASVLALFHRRLRPIAVMMVFLIAFMFRPNGYLPVPYVIMLLPFAALLVAGVGQWAFKAIRARRGTRKKPLRVLAIGWVAVSAAAVIAATPLWFGQLRGLMLADLDAPMRNAQAWIGDNVDQDARLIIDDAMWVDLVEDGRARENVVWYYKVDTDPDVQAFSPNGWQDSDYIIATESMRSFPDGGEQFAMALDNSVVVAAFGEGDQLVEVRQIVPAGLDAATESMEAAAAKRSDLGAQLLANPKFATGEESAALLTDGLVDRRIVLGLASALASSDVVVGGFPSLPGEDENARRQVAIAEIGGSAAVVDGELTVAAESFVESLDAAYGISNSSVENDQLVVRFAAPGVTQS